MSEKTVPVAVPADAPPKTLAPAEILPPEAASSRTGASPTSDVGAISVDAEGPKESIPPEFRPTDAPASEPAIEPTPGPTPGPLGGIKASAAESGESSQNQAVAL